MNRKHIVIDVGASTGVMTYNFARDNPHVEVFAFEPNVAALLGSWGTLHNYHMLPMAVSDADGVTWLYVTAYPLSSTICVLDSEAVRAWKHGEGLEVVNRVLVPVTRLDTFLQDMYAPIDPYHYVCIDYLKVDAQGADMAVLLGLGEYIHQTQKVTVEVAVTEERPYLGAPAKDDVVEWLCDRGFRLDYVEVQSEGQEENLTFVRVNAARR